MIYSQKAMLTIIYDKNNATNSIINNNNNSSGGHLQ